MTVPKHIAFIMDGNGRWALKQKKPRFFGHEAGMNKIEQVCDWCKDFDVHIGSFYAFSKENWKRPQSEVDFILSLIEKYYKQKLETLNKNNIKFIHIGDKKELPPKTLSCISILEKETENNDSFYLLFYFNYSSRAELDRAALLLSEYIVKNDINLQAVNSNTDINLSLSQFLYTKNFPDPDLLIRTSGEQRISNFLLYQLAYTELYFEPQLWPEFTRKHFEKAIKSYQKRDRRFGGLKGS